ncbi:hypothetical protein WICMUC_001548 [Wickerhamomyces mucosus]|uniref:DNA 3'-5' helicase n=1 Tax=Wickerhamomyces mucosus TaxID=1378264 RepID=A0A9P8THG5_9ASCO|nr:hypothetical protein WICMUC_001548 [Wickerhamomyces mucosus]
MDFLEQLDQLSDDNDIIEEISTTISNNQISTEQTYYDERCFNKDQFQFQGIKSVDCDVFQKEEHNKDIDQQRTFNDGNTKNELITSKPSPSASNIINPSSNKYDELIPVEQLPDKARSVFKFNYFNQIQSLCFNQLYESDHNCVISSPTGSGKTVLFELAILRLLSTQCNFQNIKILYIAPTKSLGFERQNDWSMKFSSYGLTVGVLNSDTGFVETDRVKKANIIITTPEKWDLMTRKWSDYSRLFDLIKLLLIDEVHLLKENRGSVLEVVVTRMKKICRHIRVLALSATVPNIHDVSKWIKLSSDSDSTAVTMVFGEEYRPVRLDTKVLGYKQSTNDWVFDGMLNCKVIELLKTYNKNRKPVLIFCPTRNSAISTAKYLSLHYQELQSTVSNCTIKDKELLALNKTGVSYHHAGLSLEDRLCVERDFIARRIKILCCTSTLAVGVNLPAYLVIIKGTKIWNITQFEEYSELDILQMIGRAGRPQFETEAQAIIMTSLENQYHYENFVKGNEKLESRLHLNLHENLMSEIFLKTIQSLEDALTWLKHTFFYARYRSNPTAYNEIKNTNESDMDMRLLRFCETQIKDLMNFSLIRINNRFYESTALGDAMTKHYVQFETMKLFNNFKGAQSIADILLLVSKCKEFGTIRLKRTEKRLFKDINSSPILKFPLKSKDLKNPKPIEHGYEKVYLLVQYELGGLEYPNDPLFSKLQQSFKQDKAFVFKHIKRLVKCLIDCLIENKDYVSLNNCYALSRCISGGCWEDSSIVLKQIENIGVITAKRFATHGIRTFEDLQRLQPGQIEYFGCLKPGAGNRIKSLVNNIPKFHITSKIARSYKEKSESNTVAVEIKLNIETKSEVSRWNGRPLTLIIITGLSSGELVHFRRTVFNKIQGNRSFVLKIKLKSNELSAVTSLFFDEVAGLVSENTLSFTNELDPSLLETLNKGFKKQDKPSATQDKLKSNYHLYLDLLISLLLKNLLTYYSSGDGFEIVDFNIDMDDDDDLDALLVQRLKRSRDEQSALIIQSKESISCKHKCIPESNKRPRVKKSQDGDNFNNANLRTIDTLLTVSSSKTIKPFYKPVIDAPIKNLLLNKPGTLSPSIKHHLLEDCSQQKVKDDKDFLQKKSVKTISKDKYMYKAFDDLKKPQSKDNWPKLKQMNKVKQNIDYKNSIENKKKRVQENHCSNESLEQGKNKRRFIDESFESDSGTENFDITDLLNKRPPLVQNKVKPEPSRKEDATATPFILEKPNNSNESKNTSSDFYTIPFGSNSNYNNSSMGFDYSGIHVSSHSLDGEIIKKTETIPLHVDDDNDEELSNKFLHSDFELEGLNDSESNNEDYRNIFGSDVVII